MADKDAQADSWAEPGPPEVKLTRDIKPVENGKPAETAIEVEFNLEGEIFFPTAKWSLDNKTDKPALNKIASYYEPWADTDTKLTFYLIGYADYRGGDDYNLQLSVDRATEVRNYLQSYGKFQNAKNCTFIVAGMGESKSYQPTLANRGSKANLLNLIQEDRKVEVCTASHVEQTWRVTVSGREIWDQQLYRPIGNNQYVPVYDAAEVHHNAVIEFTVTKQALDDPWDKEVKGKIVSVTPQKPVNKIKAQNDRYRFGSTLGRDLKDIVFADEHWGDKLQGLPINGKVVDDPYLLHRLYQEPKSAIVSTAPKLTDLQLRWISRGDEYGCYSSQNAADREKVPHVRLTWPSTRFMPEIYLMFDNRTNLIPRSRDHAEWGGTDGTSLWGEFLSDQLVPLKNGSRQFEHPHTRPYNIPDFMVIYFEQRVEQL